MDQIREGQATRSERRHSFRCAGIGAALLSALALGACDLSVTNPGPVQDDFLNDDGAFPAVVNGAKRAFALGYTRLALDAAMTSLEALPGGLFGGSEFDNGTLTSDNVGDHWTNVQKGRWVAEAGAQRLDDAGVGGSELHSELLLIAAFANRSLGHNMCTAVFDGGGASDFMDFFSRAEGQFDQVIVDQGAGSTLGQQALAGRADVNVWQGDWAAAIADAQAVTDNTLMFQLEYYDLDFPDSNEMMFRQASLPWREYTVWNTFLEGYYTATGDPRMVWRDNPPDPITMVNNLPFYVQQKFTEFTSPHTLASGWEMLLVEAEGVLATQGAGGVAAAMALINQAHTRNISDLDGNPLAAVATTDFDPDPLTGAWGALKQERRIELWGEARRFGDLRRWSMQNTPGAQPLEDVSGRSFCFPIATTEVDTNQELDEATYKITATNSVRFP